VIGGGDLRVDLGVHAIEGASQVARGHINGGDDRRCGRARGVCPASGVSQIERMVAGPEARGAIDLDDPIADNLRRIAFARNVRVQDLTVAILERPRHQELIAAVAASGARIRTLEEGDFRQCSHGGLARNRDRCGNRHRRRPRRTYRRLCRALPWR